MNTEWMLEAVLVFLQSSCKMPWPMDNLVLTSGFLKCYHTILMELVEEDSKEEDDDKKKAGNVKEYGPKDIENICNNACLFACIWGIGGALEESSRQEMHTYLMKLIYFDNVRETYKLDLDDEWEPRGISMK